MESSPSLSQKDISSALAELVLFFRNNNEIKYLNRFLALMLY